MYASPPVNQTSNVKFLQVIQVEPNDDAGWWIEAYDKENGSRVALDYEVSSAFFKPMMNASTGYLLIMSLSRKQLFPPVL